MIQLLDPHLYPDGLKDWKYKDRILWYQGNLDLLKKRMVSVVGTRKVSKDGIVRTRKLTQFLVKEGFTIVSGLAEGVDTIAHQSTLECRGYTIAVLGTPINQCYPKTNIKLKEEIVNKGLILSQFAVGEPVKQSNFPKRNGLMAALAEATIVIEASEKSGTRYQVQYAIKMRRKIGFLASLVNGNNPWVLDAVDKGYAFVISDLSDLEKYLGTNINLENKDNGKVHVIIHDENQDGRRDYQEGNRRGRVRFAINKRDPRDFRKLKSVPQQTYWGWLFKKTISLLKNMAH